MKKAVNLILKNSLGQVLAVSRKDNLTSFGLIGGKVDPEDTSVEAAMVRECKEETNLDVYNLKLIDVRIYGVSTETTYEQYCFIGDYTGEILDQEVLNNKGETGLVKWLDSSELETGFFGDYNREMFILAVL